MRWSARTFVRADDIARECAIAWAASETGQDAKRARSLWQAPRCRNLSTRTAARVSLNAV